jgi:hypothetical protein
MSYALLDSHELPLWFNMIRDLPDSERTRALDAFWDGQLNSKTWLSNTLNRYYGNNVPSNIHIFGGWLGVQASVLFQNSNFTINRIYNIDIDPWCKPNSEKLNKYNALKGRYVAETNDMSTYQYTDNTDIIINTSTEHVNQEIYDRWYDNIPKHSTVVVQGNDFFSCDEHVRCSIDLDDFMEMNHVTAPIFADKFKTSMYNRFMCIFKKG